ncbi:MAG: sulfatase-like hydrolase/transferase [Lachnospiraceae bacterium]|nr:sulfatase-like hydrolase/transferase [Lachnospiraceae bacterium]
MKKRIEEAIEAQDYEKAEVLIEDYEKEAPYDIEIYSYKVAVLLGKEEFEPAYYEAKKAVGLNPFLVEANYNLAITAEAMGELVEAWSYYLKTDHLQQNMEDKPIPPGVLNEQMENTYGQIQNNPEMARQLNVEFCLHKYMIYDPFKNFQKEMAGTAIVDSTGQEYYAGRCDGWLEAYFDQNANRDAFRAKCEFFPIAHVGTEYTAEKDMLVPVALNWDLNETEKNCLADTSNSANNWYYENACCKYSYIPTTGKQTFTTYKNAVWGRPIPLHSADDSKKKLILNMFFDSFNYRVIAKYGLETLMPYTAKFFKNGANFKNYYSCSEWTLPTIATYWTGKHPSTHMNLKESYRYNFMGDELTFPELFRQAGYVTAKIGGNDSVTPAQGYIRGFDRFVYQADAEGLTVKEIVMDALEHLRTFRDTNQFLWLDVVDLHNVAGGFMRSLEVQANSPLETRYIDNEIQTTVKQSHSENREVIYCNELRKIDFYLSLLYGYIEENYKDEEIIVSFFSDHGTAFIVEDDQPFISDQRTRVPLLLRGSGMKGEIDEIIETTDYAGMIAKLAGVPYSYENKDANLPKCLGGTKEREYAISQSIFVGDPYRIAFHAKDTHCYLETKNRVEEQFLINLDEFDMWMVNEKSERISDEEKQKQYLALVKQKIGHLIKYNK